MILLLIGLGAAVAAGGSGSDPLISLTYLEGDFMESLVQRIQERLTSATEADHAAAKQKLEDLTAEYRAELTGENQDEDMNYSDHYVVTEVKRGDAMDILPGSSVLMTAGRANLSAGTLVDVTAGVECVPGDVMTVGHRYIAVGSGTVTITAVSDIARLAPQGYFGQRISITVVTPFTDLSDTDWFYAATRYAYMGGLFNGVSEDQFLPMGSMTRSMLATVLHRLAGEPETESGAAFTDVPAGQWYTEAVSWSSAAGVVQGMGDNTFAPDSLVTRAQMAVMLYRYAGTYLERDVSASVSLTQFSDSAKVPAWAEDAMKWAVSAGIITGRNDGTLDPTGTASRAEVATMLQRFSLLISVG